MNIPIKYSKYIPVFLVFLLIFSCKSLVVENENDPSQVQVLADPADTESLIGGSFQDWWHSNQHPGVAMPLAMISDQLTSHWGNWNMGTFSREPRNEIVNTPTSAQAELMERGFQGPYNAIGAVNDGLNAVHSGVYVDSLRAVAFGRFMQGIIHCNIALFFDKGYIVDENSDLETDAGLAEAKTLHPYPEVFEAGKEYLDECIEICDTYTFSSNLPNDWFNGNSPDAAMLKRLAHSYYARYLAGMARTPAERANVNWNEVISHAEQGITSPFEIDGDGNLWWDGMKYFGHAPGWTRVDYMVIGPADTSGTFDNWLANEPADREAFIIQTADRRIAGADSATAPGTDFKYAGPSFFFTYRDSYYEPLRYVNHYLTGANSAMSIFDPAELRLLIAEGKYRQNDLDGAASIINETRVGRGQLDPVSGSAENLFEYLKYEKLIETFITAGGLQWVEKRGWGDLPTGAPLHLPVPASELEILLQDYYTFGGEGGNMAAKRASKNIFPRSISWIK